MSSVSKIKSMKYNEIVIFANTFLTYLLNFYTDKVINNSR